MSGGGVRRALQHVRNASAALLAVAAAASAFAGPSGAEAVAGSAGTDTSLPLTDSAVTVHGRGEFADLEITVNQTRNLVNQAVSITWEGGRPTTRGLAPFNGDYLQIMQCWGDPDDTIAVNPGPPPEQCVQGATDAVYGGRLTNLFGGANNTLTRIISRSDLPTYDPGDGVLDPRTGLVWRPFVAVDGTEVAIHYDPEFNPAVGGGNYWLNPYFNLITTNEVPGGRTRPDGTGEELFEVTTGLESTGLGCGQLVQPVAGGAPKVPQCWLVVVPRGDPAVENAGLIPNPGATPVITSPLSTRAWQNRIAIPLEFNPVGSSCSLADEPRRLAGTEHLQIAISSWQAALCGRPGLSPYAYGTLSDTTARRQLLSGVTGSPGLVAVSRPLDPESLDPGNPVVYAPLTASATVIGFNIERFPKPGLDPAEDALSGIRVAEINLTPRLVAKLLTQSYRLNTSIKFVPPPYDWLSANSRHLAVDPDFLRFNPEFELLNISGGKNMAGLVVPARSSDAARQLWEWVLADPEAKAWLDGAPDQWGMKVNPIYAATSGANSTGIPFGLPVPESYPKSDPYCFQGPPTGPNGSVTPPALCGTDWIPYAQTLRDSARVTRAADDGARTNEDPNAESAEKVYSADGPQLLGSRAILSVTDSASAVQYGLQMARLSRPGDNGSDRRFVAPDDAGISAGLAAMRPGAEPTFLEPDPTADAPAAYPLTVLTYGAVVPLSQDATARSEYAAFVEYAAGAGQVAGRELGQLPAGYTPLSPALRAHAEAAARTIRDLQAVPAATPVPAEPSVFGIPSMDVATPSGAANPSGRGAASTPTAVPGSAAGEEDEPSGDTLLTPFLALARNRFVLPALALLALLSALGSLEITKWPRRARGAGPTPRGTAG